MGEDKQKVSRRLRLAGRLTVALTLIVTGIAVLADAWHQWELKLEVDGVKEAIGDSERYLQGGTPAERWHEKKVSHSNGWLEVSFLWEAGRYAQVWDRSGNKDRLQQSPDGRLWLGLEQVRNYHTATARQLEADAAEDGSSPGTEYSDEDLRELLKNTEELPAACSRANKYDTVSPIRVKGTLTDNWSQRLSEGDTWTIKSAMFGRLAALESLGEIESVESELLVYARFWSKYCHPLNSSDASYRISALLEAFEKASAGCSEGTFSEQALDEMLALPIDADSYLEETLVADVVWMSMTIQREEYALRDPDCFEWLSRRKSAPPDSESYSNPLARFGQRREYCRYVRVSLLFGIQCVNVFRHPRPWSELKPSEVTSEFFASYTPRELPELSMGFRRLDVARVDLELHMLERKSGPLAEQREQVEQLLADHATVGHRWDGDALEVFPVPFMEFPPDAERDEVDSRKSMTVRLESTH